MQRAYPARYRAICVLFLALFGCVASARPVVTIQIIEIWESIDPPAGGDTLTAYPNPAISNLTLEGGDGIDLQHLTILDHQGQVVLNRPLAGNEVFSVTFPAEGLYTFLIQTQVGVMSKIISVLEE